MLLLLRIKSPEHHFNALGPCPSLDSNQRFVNFKSTASTAGLEGLALSSRLELKLKASKASVLPLHHERSVHQVGLEPTITEL